MNAQLQPLEPAEAARTEGKLTVHRLIELAEAAGFKRGEVLDLAQERRGLRDNFAARAIHAELTQRGIQINPNTPRAHCVRCLRGGRRNAAREGGRA